MSAGRHVIVVGAGPAGLAAAYALGRAGARATVLEAGPHLGGLARTVALWGRRYELGSHIVSGGDRRAVALWRELAGGDAIRVPLRRAVLLRGRLAEYPFTPLGVARVLGAARTARGAAGLAAARLRSGRGAAGDAPSTEAWMARRFGPALYDALLRGYVEKLWGRPGSAIDAAFAAGLVGTAHGTDDVPDIETPGDHFLHPRGGLGDVWARMADAVRAAGGEVRLETPACALTRDAAGRVDGAETPAGHLRAAAVVSSMPLPRLLQALPGAPAELVARARTLEARGTVLVYLRAATGRRLPHAWLHVYDPALRAGRVTNFRAWDQERPLPHAPAGDVFALEYWCGAGDPLWAEDDAALARRAAAELEASGAVGAVRVLGAHVERLPATHPVPALGAAAVAAEALAFARSVPGLETVGRHGGFAVDSVALAIAGGLAAAARVLGGA